MGFYIGWLDFLDIFLKITRVILGSQPLGAADMKKHNHPVIKSQPKSIFGTAKHAIVHVMVFSIISVAGHVATSGLSASLSDVGRGIAPPIGGMYWM